MKKKFIKNISVFILSMIAVLVYLKLITYYINIDILAEYFKIKALGMIIYYCFSVRYSEFSYILKAQKNYSFYRMKKIYSLYVVFILSFSIIVFLGLFILDTLFYLIILSYFIFLLNDLVDSYVAINRLYHRYLMILIIKGGLIFKSLSFYILVQNLSDISLEQIFLFEIIFHFIFALCLGIIILYKINMKDLILYTAIYKNNLINIKNTWLGNISKIPYEAFPTYFLSFFTNSTLFVEYNVARKVYSMAIYANQPFIQILNTYSIDFKNNFLKYLNLYYVIILILNIFIGVILFLFPKEIISLLTNKIYATEHTINLIFIMFIMYCFYNIIYPFRQFIVLKQLLKFNNTGTIVSILIILITTLVFIPIFNTYALSFIQPLGLILPIILTFILIKK